MINKMTNSKNISSTSDFWTIQHVIYRNNFCKIDLLKTLLENGNLKTQDQWVEYSKQAKTNNNFYVGDMPLYHSLFASLHKFWDKPETGKIRDFLQTQFKTKRIMTLTRIKYQTRGLDKIIHNYKMPNEYLIEDDFVGPDESIKNSNNKQNYKSLLDSDNLKEINSIYNWITEKEIYLSRLNSRPNKEEEKPVKFYAELNYTDLNCFRGPSKSGSSIGVRVQNTNY